MRKLNVKTLIFSLVIVAVLLTTTLTSCITFDKPSTTTTTASTVAATAATTTSPVSTSIINSNWNPITTDGNSAGQYSIADVVQMVKPSVVAINTEVTVNDPFFGSTTQQGAGSGWIIDSNGIIVTNNHVIEGAKTITVTTDAGVTYTADMNSVYTDAYNDLAIIKISATGLPALRIGDASKLRLGDWVIAIGNALGQGTRVTEGIVSRLNVSLDVDQNQTLYNLIETSAAINPGNSGGPLLNLSGEVIGITSAKISSVGVEGMGYAISIDTATPVIKELVNKGYVTRPYIGVSLYTVDNLAIRHFNLKIDKGVVILDVSAGGPAENAGLKVGDVIVTAGGKDVTTVQELTDVIHNSTIGSPLEIKYWRGNTQNIVSVTPIQTQKTQN